MIKMKGLNLYRVDEWLPAVESELETRYPIKEKGYYIQNPLIVEETVSGNDGTRQEELTLIRAALKGYNVSVARAGTGGCTSVSMLMTIAVEANAIEHIFTFYAYEHFPKKIHYTKNTPVEIFFMLGVLEIEEIKNKENRI